MAENLKEVNPILMLSVGFLKETCFLFVLVSCSRESREGREGCDRWRERIELEVFSRR